MKQPNNGNRVPKRKERSVHPSQRHPNAWMSDVLEIAYSDDDSPNQHRPHRSGERGFVSSSEANRRSRHEASREAHPREAPPTGEGGYPSRMRQEKQGLGQEQSQFNNSEEDQSNRTDEKAGEEGSKDHPPRQSEEELSSRLKTEMAAYEPLEAEEEGVMNEGFKTFIRIGGGILLASLGVVAVSFMVRVSSKNLATARNTWKQLPKLPR